MEDKVANNNDEQAETEATRRPRRAKIGQFNPGKSTMAVLPISVGQPYHEGDKMEATVHVLKRKFGKIHVLVCDSSKRHNIQLEGHDAETSLSIAKERGDNWLATHQGLLEAAGAVVSRWDDWRHHADFPALHARMKALFEMDPVFAATIDKDAERYLMKKDAPADAALAASRAYLLEELAVDILIAENVGGAFFYPGSRSASLEYLRTVDFGDRLNPLPNLGYGKIKFH